MKKLAEVKTSPDDKYGSVDLEKLVGRKVARVEGYASSEFGSDTMVFKLSRITFEGGATVHVEGEHDCPYIPSDKAELNLDQETLKALWDEENG